VKKTTGGEKKSHFNLDQKAKKRSNKAQPCQALPIIRGPDSIWLKLVHFRQG